MIGTKIMLKFPSNQGQIQNFTGVLLCHLQLRMCRFSLLLYIFFKDKNKYTVIDRKILEKNQIDSNYMFVQVWKAVKLFNTRNPIQVSVTR